MFHWVQDSRKHKFSVFGRFATIITTLWLYHPQFGQRARAWLAQGRAGPCSNVAVLYMVIEEYRLGPGPVYERAAAQGRMLPEGLRYIDSWVIDGRLDRCFQLMETDRPELLDAWRARWADLVDFDVFPVITSREAAQRSAAR